MNLYGNIDPAMRLVGEFEEKAARAGRRPLLKDALKFAGKLGMKLELQHPDPTDHTGEGQNIEREYWSLAQEGCPK